MMRLKYISTSIALCTWMLIVAGACNNTAQVDYKKLVDEQRSSGLVDNRIVLDIGFGMSSQEFYDYCWQINKEGLASQGPKNRTVQVEIEDLSKPGYMLFYPNFEDDKIVEMPILFGLHDWSPWNEESFGKEFIFEIRDLVEDWYSIELQLAIDTTGYPGYIGINGNKKAALTVQDDQFVKLIVSDMNHIAPGEQLVYKRN